MQKPLIIDTFMFGGAGFEPEILEIRLNELDPYVDYFIFTESDKSQIGLDKPLYFQENRQRFEKFLPKIIDVQLTDFNYVGGGSWANENFQRDAIMRLGFEKLEKEKNIKITPEDWVILSDLDEIPSGPKIKEVVESNPDQIVSFNHRFISYFLNLESSQRGWWGSCLFKVNELREWSFQAIRNHKDKFQHIGRWNEEYHGWHLSSMCGHNFDLLFNKYLNNVEPYNKNFLFQPNAKEELQKLYELIVVQEKWFFFADDPFKMSIKMNILDKSLLPEYVVKNEEKFKDLLLPYI
jgi:beta-1,4-mannosyl-glycoprotein beta-1,4-N-acetylglucosaminyltransferase